MLSTGWKLILRSGIRFLVLLALLFPSIASALEGVEKAVITVHGKEYSIVVGNNERRSDVYFLKKALNGDKEAREMFLQGEKERLYYIGEDSPIWLKVSMDNEEVIKP